jgi:hypothetical protein
MLDELKERLRDLYERYQRQEIALRRAASTLEAISGAIQEVRYWIGKLEKREEEPEEENKVVS